MRARLAAISGRRLVAIDHPVLETASSAQRALDCQGSDSWLRRCVGSPSREVIRCFLAHPSRRVTMNIGGSYSMKRSAIRSTAIASVGYDAAARELEIEFRSGRVYRYQDVPSDVHQFMLRTPEKGRYVNRVITKHFAHRDVTPRLPERTAEPDVASALEASIERLRKDRE
jgi:hypothetical protein